MVRPKDFLTTGKFGYTLYTKETSQKSILSSESGHGWNVHKNWPLGEIRRFGQRNKFYEDYSKCKKHLIKELRAYLFHNSIVKRVEAYDPMITEHKKKTTVTVTNVDDSQLAEFFEDMTEQQNVVEGNTEKVTQTQINWVLPYHPEIAKLNLDVRANRILSWYFNDTIKIRIAWKNEHQNLSAIMRSMIIRN